MIYQRIKEYAPERLRNLLEKKMQGENSATAGFTIMESIVAITILLIVVSGIMNLVYQGSTASEYQRERITATYLAADAIEFLRWSRDTWWLQDYTGNTFQEWLAGDADQDITQCRSDMGNECQIDTRPGNTSIQNCSGACDPLDYNYGRGYYGHESGPGWSESRYTRTITVNPTAGNDGAEITVTITWPRSGGGTGTVTVTEIIYDYIELN